MASFTNKNGSPMDVNYLDIHLKRTAEVQLQKGMVLNDQQLKEFLKTTDGQNMLTQQLDKIKNEFKTNIFCASLLDNIHDFREQFNTGITGLYELQKVITDNNLMNKPSPYTCVIHNEDTYLKSLGLERNVNGHWIDTEKSDNYFLKEYKFINSTADNKWQNPIKVAIENIFGSAIENGDVSFPYRNIDLVVDTQKGFFDAIKDYTHYFNWLDCAATRIDPAGKSNPKTKPILTDLTEKDSNKQNSTNYKVYYNSIQEVLNIPSYKNNTFPVNENEEDRNTVLFSSNCDITLYTGENKKAYALIRPDGNTNIHANKKYIVPHTFLQKSNKIQQTIQMVKNLLYDLINKQENTSFKSFKNEQTKKYQTAKKNTDMHYLMKRFGDAIQALYCVYLQNQSQGNIPWLVTYDRPLLGHAIYYKTPVIVYCNQKRVNGRPGSGLTIAIHSSVLSDKAVNARKAADDAAQKKALKEEKEAEENLSIEINKNKAFIKTTLDQINNLIQENINFVIDTDNLNNETYKNFLKFLYINFYKNKKYEFINSLRLLLNEVININEGIDINNHITRQNIIDKKIDKIEKLKNKITNYKVKDNINTRDRVEMILRGVRGKLGKYKTIVPEAWGRRRYTNIGGKTFLIQTKNKISKMVIKDQLNRIVNVIVEIIRKLGEVEIEKTKVKEQNGGAKTMQKKLKEQKKPDTIKKTNTKNSTPEMTKNRILEYKWININNNILTEIFDYYTEIYIFHRINTLVIDNYIEEHVLIENIITNLSQVTHQYLYNYDLVNKAQIILEQIEKRVSQFKENTLHKIIEFYSYVYADQNFEKIQELLNIEHKNYPERDEEDINRPILLQKLNNKNIFNNTVDIEYEPDIVTSKNINSTLLYDLLYDYNSKLNIINNTYKEYDNSIQSEDNGKQLEITFDVISIDNLNNVFEKDENNNDFDNSFRGAINSINELLKIYNDIPPPESKVAAATVKKIPNPINVSTKRMILKGGKRERTLRKNKKTRKNIKKPNKTKKKHKNNKTSLPKSKKKTKKVKKKRRNKTKIKKGGNKKKHKKKVKKKRNKKNKKKKQLFEMSIKELKEYVKNKK